MGIEKDFTSNRITPARRARKSGERGATILEFAFTLVVTLVLVFGIIDFARALYSYHFVSFAAREGARFASVRGIYSCDTSVTPCQASQADVNTFVGTLVPQGIDAGQVTATYTVLNGNLNVCGPGNAYPGCAAQVTVIYPFSFIFPSSFYSLAPVAFNAAQIHMSSTATITISR